MTMDWNRVEGNWKQFKGKAKEKWVKLTDDDLNVIEGRRDQLEAVALLQLAFQLIAATLDHVEIIIGEFAPLLLGLAFDLLPVAFNPVPIHRYPPWRERDSNGLIIQTFREPIGKVQAGFCAGSHTAFGPAPSLRWTSS